MTRPGRARSSKTSQSDSTRPRRRGALIAAAVIVAAMAAAAYWPAIAAPFLFDDFNGIAANRSIEQLSTALHPPPNTAFSGRPVANLSLAVNVAVNRALGRTTTDTVGFHLLN